MVVENEPKFNIEQVLPILTVMEKKRKQKLILFCILLMFGILLSSSFLFILISCFLYDSEAMFLVRFSIVLLGVYLIYKAFLLKKDFSREVKRNCLKTALSTFGQIRWFDKLYGGLSSAITYDELRSSQLFGTFSHMNTDDEFEGCYKGVHFEISEIQLYKMQHLGRGYALTNVFKGVAISFNVYKTIKNRTIISTKGDLISRNSWRLGLIQMLYIILTFIPLLLIPNIWVAISSIVLVSGILMLSYRNKDKLTKINIEDTEFAKIFDIYSSDEVEARYFLTTAFAERLKSLKTAFHTNKIKCTQLGNKFMIAISTKKDLFEVGSLFHKLDDEKVLSPIYKELYAVYKMIDTLKFNERTGL